jgi:hypothetical protein
MGLPNVIEPRHEFIGVNLGLTFCRERMKRLVSQFQVLKYPPSIAPRAVGIRLNIDSEFGGIHHYQNHRSAISYASSPSKPRALQGAKLDASAVTPQASSLFPGPSDSKTARRRHDYDCHA